MGGARGDEKCIQYFDPNTRREKITSKSSRTEVDNIKMDLQESVVWIHLTQNKDQALEIAVTNILVP